MEAHLWPHGPECPRCHGRERVTKLQGKSTRIGTEHCKDCRKPFTVKIGTIFEDSHIPMRMWLQAICAPLRQQEGHLVQPTSPDAGRHSQVGLVHVATASARLCADGDLAPMGGGGGVVEIDETMQGRVKAWPSATTVSAASVLEAWLGPCQTWC